MRGDRLNVHVSFPPGSEPANLGDWEDVVAAHVPPARTMIVVVDGTPGNYRVRSAHLADGFIGDVTPDATRLLRAAHLI